MHTAHALMISAKLKKKKTSAIGVHGKGSVASVTRIKRPRAGSHQRMILLTALSSFPLSEPSLKELHTRRAPPGLGQNVRPHARPLARNEQSPHVDVKRTFNIRVHTCPHRFLPMACQALPSEACGAYQGDTHIMSRIRRSRDQ